MRLVYFHRTLDLGTYLFQFYSFCFSKSFPLGSVVFSLIVFHTVFIFDVENVEPYDIVLAAE